MSQSKNHAAAEFGFTAEEMGAMLASLSITGAAEELSDAFFLKVSSEQWASVKHIRDAVAYLGFDPRKIIGEFLAKAKVNPALPTDVPKEYKSPSGGVYQLHEKNHAATDLLFFITLFLERGNNISKMLLKCDKEVSDLIRRKAAAYGIVMERKQNQTILGTSSLTLARISQAFPVATASLIVSNEIPGKLKTKALAGIVSLPMLMQHTIFPSLIPDEDDEYCEQLKTIALVLNLETSILLATPKEKRKLEDRDVDDLAQQAEQFVNAAMTGCLLTTADKIKILTKGGILNSSGELELAVKVCYTTASRFLAMGRKSYSKAVKACRAQLEAITTKASAADPSKPQSDL